MKLLRIATLAVLTGGTMANTGCPDDQPGKVEDAQPPVVQQPNGAVVSPVAPNPNAVVVPPRQAPPTIRQDANHK